MSYIDKDATLAAIANKAKAELADANRYFLEGVQLAVDVVEGMTETDNLVKDSQSLAKELVNDCISRQAAIDALHMHLMYRMGTDSNKKRLDEWVNNLPSAQPETAERTTEMAQNVSDGDLISRKAAMNRIDEALARVFKEPCGELILRKVPSAQPEPHWIPCSERLPEEKDAGILKKLGTEKRSEYVIATVEVKGERMTVTACTYDGKWDWNMKYAFPDFKVVAWMPLPEPYKEDDNDHT